MSAVVGWAIAVAILLAILAVVFRMRAVREKVIGKVASDRLAAAA